MHNVIATARGYYGNILREEGDVFQIASKDEFSDNWMKMGKAASAAKPASDEKPKAYAGAVKMFKSDDKTHEVAFSDAMEAALLAFTSAEPDRGVADWNALDQKERKELITAEAVRMLDLPPA